MEPRVVITGVGILACNGEGKDAYWQALREGRVGYKPITLFDASEFHVKIAGELTTFDPVKYVGPKKLRTLDRATRLMISSARLAVDDCGFKITDENTDDVGVSVGTTFGSLKSIHDFDMTILREGPRYVNPAHFPNTVINSPASQISIWNNIQGFNTTISTGFTSSVDAMSYAADFIRWERAKLVFTGSVEELCWITYWGFHTVKFLSGSKEGTAFINCPFDKRRNGITFGEGAALLAFENENQAKERNARIYAEVLGFGYYFDPFRIAKYNPRGPGVRAAIRDCLDDAGMDITDIDYICANANSTQPADKIETDAIKEIFGQRAYKIPVSAVKSMTGECYSLSGMLQAVASVGVIAENFIPPTVNYQEPDPNCDLDYVPNVAREATVDNVLIITFSPSGSNSCMVLGRYKG